MTRINELQDDLVKARKIASRYEPHREGMSSRTSSFFQSSWAERIKELEAEISVEQAKRRKEVFELRLIGSQVANTSVPLGLLAKLAEPLNKLITNASYKMRHSKDAHSIPKEWADMLDLRLENLAFGSSRLVMSGNVSPDLVGDSPTQDALNAIFAILGAPYEEFIDSLHTIGVKAAKNLACVLEAMEGENLACEFSWSPPSGEHLIWKASIADMAHMRTLLEGVDEPIEEEETIQGIVTLLAATGRLELKIGEAPCKVHFDKRRPELIEDYHIGQKIKIRVQKTTYLDPVEKEPVSKYELLTDDRE